MSQKKCFYLDDEELELLQSIKTENGLKTDTAVISFLLRNYSPIEMSTAIKVREELEKNYLPKERIRWGVQTAEQNSVLILDALNTILWQLKTNIGYRYDDIPHPIIKESEDELKRKIAYFKQKSDEKKLKRIEE